MPQVMNTTRLLSGSLDGNYLSKRIRPEQQGGASKGFYDELRIGPCLFVSREMGSGGGEIANKVAKRLGWTHLDKEIIDKLVSQYGTPRVVLDAVDEKRVGWLTDLLNGWVEGHGFSQLAYVNRLGRLFNMAAKRGNVVIVGRGAKFQLPKSTGFSVRIIAPMDFRIEQIVLQRGVSVAEAKKLIQRSDADRRAFVSTFFHEDIADPHVHDLVVNIKQITPDSAVQLICDAVGFWMTRNGFTQRQHAVAT
jgi:cytidylate kinase